MNLHGPKILLSVFKMVSTFNLTTEECLSRQFCFDVLNDSLKFTAGVGFFFLERKGGV